MLLTKTYRLGLSALFAGAILPLAFAPIDFWPLAIVSPALLLWLFLTLKTAGLAFIIGLLYGIGCFGVGVSWVFVSIHDFGNTHISIALLITALFILLLSLFIAAQGYLLKRFFKGDAFSFCLLGFPTSWVLLEWFRSWILTGFPWLYLGYSQLTTPLSGYAPILSVYAVSLSVVLTSGALVALFTSSKITQKILSSSLIILIWGTGFFLKNEIFTTHSTKAYHAALVQGNIKPFDKFTRENPIASTEETYGLLTQSVLGADIILWPESAIPVPLPYANDYVEQLNQIAKQHHSTLITGIQTITPQNEYYNSLIAVGNGSGLYHKYHLVPFGDFLPFEHFLRGLIGFFDLPMSSFIAGPDTQPLITAGDITVAPLICYEIAFPELLRTNLQNANVIITLSEDGWFGKSLGPHQHLQIAQMRALETGRFVLRATTAGLTAIINPQGQLTTTVPAFTKTVLNGTFYAVTGNTPWVNIGLWPLLLLCFGGFILPGRLVCYKRRPNKN